MMIKLLAFVLVITLTIIYNIKHGILLSDKLLPFSLGLLVTELIEYRVCLVIALTLLLLCLVLKVLNSFEQE